MSSSHVALVAIMGAAFLSQISAAPVGAESFKMPPEVTPALRAACEQDVRRVCIGENPTTDKVRSCVMQRYGEFSTRCKLQIAAAGLGRTR